MQHDTPNNNDKEKYEAQQKRNYGLYISKRKN